MNGPHARVFQTTKQKQVTNELQSEEHRWHDEELLDGCGRFPTNLSSTWPNGPARESSNMGRVSKVDNTETIWWVEENSNKQKKTIRIQTQDGNCRVNWNMNFWFPRPIRLFRDLAIFSTFQQGTMMLCSFQRTHSKMNSCSSRDFFAGRLRRATARARHVVFLWRQHEQDHTNDQR